MQYKYISTVILCFLVFVGTSQTNNNTTITGQVLDSSARPIPFVNVIVKGMSLGDITNISGEFTIKKVPIGNYKITASIMGYSSQTRKVNIENSKKVTLNFSLEEEVSQLDKAIVYGKSKAQKVKEMALHVNAIDVTGIANTSADLNQVLNRSTGVKVREQGGMGSNFNFSINGLSGSAVKFFIDGVPMEAMGSSMTLNNIPVNLAKRIEVYKGVVPVELGSDALGGAVNIITNQDINKYLDVSYSFGSFNTHRVALTGLVRDKKTGLTLKANAYYNYSDNNYLMHDVEIFDTIQNKYVEKDFKRFHDQFKSAFGQIEVGVTGKRWADVFFIGTSFTKENKEIQTGSTQNLVYGGPERNSKAYNASLHYKKTNLFIKNLDASLYASYLKDTYKIIDTMLRKYEWDGSYIEANRAEVSREERSSYIYKRPKTFIRTNLNYTINKHHSFNTNYLLTDLKNNVRDEYNPTDIETTDQITKQIAGLSYQQNWLNNKWTNTFFGKYYSNDLKIERESLLGGDKEEASKKVKTYGYGIASRYKINNDSGIKISFEHAYRLQSPDQILGDGIDVLPNFNLNPENSKNLNLGAYLGYTYNYKHRFFVEGSWFYRDIKDYIFRTTLINNTIIKYKYKNISDVKISGFESELKYNYSDLFQFTINASYQDAINNTKTDDDGAEEVTYKHSIPNKPWFFGNADLSIGKSDVFGTKNNRLDFNYAFQYTHWFYLRWGKFGNPKDKDAIPGQYIHNAQISYAFQNGKYNISLECKNLTNALAYDNFKLQKPGRGFYIKLRAFLN